MRFEPLSEEQLQTAMLLPDGSYDYSVFKSEEKTSQAGNEYISLQLCVYDANGKENFVYTNLALIKLLKHFCDVNNMQDAYQSGNVEADHCQNKSSGKVVIGVEGEKPNPRGGMYKAKNIVLDYVSAPLGSPMTPLAPLTKENDFINDDLPF